MTRLVHDKQELSVLQLICGGSLEGTLAVIKGMNSNRVLLECSAVRLPHKLSAVTKNVPMHCDIFF